MVAISKRRMKWFWLYIVLIFFALASCSEGNSVSSNHAELTNVEIVLTDSIQEILTDYRNEAVESQVLLGDNKDWVDAQIVLNSDTLAAKIRLKGDNTDHLNGKNWSFRVKLKEGTLFGKREFSLQHPRTRGYDKEWILHDLLKNEGILTTEYRFVQLKLKDQIDEIYAFEEHFEPELTGQLQPIFKFDESAFWRLQRIERETDSNIDFKYPVFASSEIQTFNSKSILKSDTLLEEFYRGRSLLAKYRSRKISFSDCFDVDYEAKMYALLDLLNGDHALIWHNRRFILNDQGKLQSVVYDAFTEEEFKLTSRTWLMDNSGNFKTNYYPELAFVFDAFNDPVFREKYLEYLNYYTQEFDWKAYLNSVNQNSELIQLQKKFDIAFDVNSMVEKRTQQLDSLLKVLNVDSEEKWFDYQSITDFAKDHPEDKGIPDLMVDRETINGLTIQAFVEFRTDFEQKVTLLNYHQYPIQIVGSGFKSNKIDQQANLFLSSYIPDKAPEVKILKIPATAEFIFYKVEGIDSVFVREISPFNLPKERF